jgi:hypothetical protein
MAIEDKEYYKQRIEDLENEQHQDESISYDCHTSVNEIRNKIAEIEGARRGIFNAAREKGASISNYDRAIAITIIKLKNGLITEMSDPETGEMIEIKNFPASVLPQLAKGICWMESGRKEEAEAIYKAILSNIDAIKAELNGLQTIAKIQ